MSFYPDEQWVNWVDHLAEHEFLVIDDFLPQHLFLSVREFFLARLKENDFKKAGIGAMQQNHVDSSIRGDFTFWLDKERDRELKLFFNLVEEIIERFNRYCFLSLSGYEFHLAHYPQGTFYKRHLDSFENRSNRMISVIIYLNEWWKEGDGGELKIYRDNEDQLVAPIPNRCVLMKADKVEHEVLHTNIGRYSLTGWLLYQPSGVGYLFT